VTVDQPSGAEPASDETSTTSDPSDPAELPSRFAAARAVLDGLDALARQDPDLPELSPVTIDGDTVTATPWLLCQPVTALARWIDALGGADDVHVLRFGASGTQLTAVKHLPGAGSTPGATLQLQVLTNAPLSTTRPDGRPGRGELARLLADEADVPDLSSPLTLERVRAPNAPMPPWNPPDSGAASEAASEVAAAAPAPGV
jgi:hypothetical protein